MKIGFRQWGMQQGRLFPAGYALGLPWNQEGPTRFRCAAGLCKRPGFGCQCGLYVRPRLSDVDRRAGNGRFPLVVGAVQAWGGYVIHGDEFYTELGRYELALPVAFVKPTAGSAWGTVFEQRELQWIAEKLGALILEDRPSLQAWAADQGQSFSRPETGKSWWEKL